MLLILLRFQISVMVWLVATQKYLERGRLMKFSDKNADSCSSVVRRILSFSKVTRICSRLNVCSVTIQIMALSVGMYYFAGTRSNQVSDWTHESRLSNDHHLQRGSDSSATVTDYTSSSESCYLVMTDGIPLAKSGYGLVSCCQCVGTEKHHIYTPVPEALWSFTFASLA